LDEPTTGVDAVSRKEFWELLRDLQKQSITIIVSTPYMDEASLCDRVALIQEGSIMKIDSPSNITKQFGKPLWAFKADNMYKLMTDLVALPEVLSCYPFGSEHHVVFKDPNQDGDVIKRKLTEHNVSFQQIGPTIEDCFMDLMRSK
jgi:ABC-type multidrug transport system ATPase subunit